MNFKLIIFVLNLATLLSGETINSDAFISAKCKWLNSLFRNQKNLKKETQQIIYGFLGNLQYQLEENSSHKLLDDIFETFNEEIDINSDESNYYNLIENLIYSFPGPSRGYGPLLLGCKHQRKISELVNKFNLQNQFFIKAGLEKINNYLLDKYNVVSANLYNENKEIINDLKENESDNLSSLINVLDLFFKNV